MSAVSQLQLASHGGIQFPWTECRVSIEQRHHVHIYVHTPGGEVEKLGRGLYRWEFAIPAHDTLRPPFQNFYSRDLPRLWALWESGATAPAQIPNMGTVQAFAPNARRTLRGNIASGEPVEVTLLEDQQALASFSAVFTPSMSAVPLQLRTFVRRTQGLVKQSLLDRLLSLLDEVLFLIGAGAQLARNLIGSLTSLFGLCEELRRETALQQPDNFDAFDLLLSMHATILAMLLDVQRRGRATTTAITTVRMSATQIAAWAVKDTSRVMELLALNDWPDPLSVPAGSLVRYYV